MPTDVVQVQQNRWFLRNAHREFHPANLFGGPWGRLTPADIVDGLDVEYDETNGQPSGIRRYPVLPATTRQLVAQHGCQHPGVALDKLAYRYGDQNLAKGTLSDVVRVNQSLSEACQQDRRHWYRGQLARWQETIRRSGPGAVPFRCVTTGPLTLHLARASALENAGICLHPLYGFVYLPGSGLKGMARAYAETVWFPAQYAGDEAGTPKDQVERGKAVDAWRTIEAVFGWAPNSDSKKPWKRRDISGDGKHDREHCGQIIFHDAWPTAWPKLIVDILNNHHAGYYQGNDAPGDWENPVPVYFLAVERDSEFEFALARRRDDVPDSLLDQARQWLLGALCHLGVGAKTNAGYGSFKPVEGQRPALASPRHETFEATLELVTPAFLAGANQQAADCDLRPATLRGLLRWWWRTLHAGFVDTATLRAMEAEIWGDTEASGKVAITIEKLRHVGPFECVGKRIGKNKKNQAVLEPDPNFLQAEGIESAPRFTTQGLFYAAYGTDEMKTGDLASRKRRWYLDAGSQWRVKLIARPSHHEENQERGAANRRGTLAATMLLEQARCALWLLCHFGGVGSKGRKGFGSLADLGELSSCRWETVLETAETFRRIWQAQRRPYKSGVCDSLSLQAAQRLAIATPWTNPWFALDQLGASRQSFAQAPRQTGHGKHCAAKAALGLPRRIHGPLPFKLPHQEQYTPPEELRSPVGDRYAAPVVFHVGRSPTGLELRVLAFVPKRLWAMDHHDERTGPENTERTLQQFVQHLRADLSERSKRLAGRGRARAPSAPQPARPSGTMLPSHGRSVEAELLREKTKKGGWRAKHLDTGISGPVQNTAAVPADKQPGDKVTLVVASANPREIAFRWPS